MEELQFKSEISVESQKKNSEQYQLSRVIIHSNIDNVGTKNSIDESRTQEKTYDTLRDFKTVLNAKYPEFKKTLVSAIREEPIESGVHYLFEDKFNDYFEDNPYMAIQLLQVFLRDYYTDTKKVKAVLHIVSHYTYEQLGEDFVYPILSLINHTNKGIKKFALKVFDNWDSIETLSLLKGTEMPKERWLCEYKEKIVIRLERKNTNAIFFTSN